MLITFLNWIYVAVTTYTVGYFVLKKILFLIYKDDSRKIRLMDCLMAGFFVITMYAGFFSIFAKVGAAANVVLAAVCLVIMFLERKNITTPINIKNPLQNSAAGIAFYVLSALVCIAALVYTAESTFHYDTGLYHAQAIRWAEEYGMVKGTGLLHFRLAYNSTYFPLCALYSFRDITGGQSLHSLSGYIALIVCIYSVYGIMRSVKNRTILRASAFSDLLRIAPLLCLLIVCMEITSPETDFAVSFCFYWLCIRYAELCEDSAEDTIAFALLSVSSFAILGYKLTSAVVCLVIVKPLIELIVKHKKYGLIAVFGAMCLLLILPYLIRNYFISGWLIYPFDGIDIFNVPWKIPKEVLNGDAGMILQGSQVGNSGIPEGVSMEAFGWLKRWWEDNYYATRMFYSTLIMALPLCGIGVLFGIIVFAKKKKADPAAAGMLTLIVILAFCLVFWFIKGPAIRYGYPCVLTFPLAVCGYVIYNAYRVENHTAKIAAVLAAYAASVVVYLPTIISVPAIIKFNYEESVARFSPKEHIISQVDYPVPEANERQWHGVTVYWPKEGDQMWYVPFVSSPYDNVYEDVEWYGDDITDGMYLKNAGQ